MPTGSGGSCVFVRYESIVLHSIERGQTLFRTYYLRLPCMQRRHGALTVSMPCADPSFRENVLCWLFFPLRCSGGVRVDRVDWPPPILSSGAGMCIDGVDCLPAPMSAQWPTRGTGASMEQVATLAAALRLRHPLHLRGMRW